MKKAILILILLATMGLIVSSADLSLSISQTEKDALNDIGITEPDISKLSCDDTYCYFTISQTKEIEIFNAERNLTRTKTVSIINKMVKFRGIDEANKTYSDKALIDIRNKETEKALSTIGKETIIRNDDQKAEKLTDIKVTV